MLYEYLRYKSYNYKESAVHVQIYPRELCNSVKVIAEQSQAFREDKLFLRWAEFCSRWLRDSHSEFLHCHKEQVPVVCDGLRDRKECLATFSNKALRSLPPFTSRHWTLLSSRGSRKYFGWNRTRSSKFLTQPTIAEHFHDHVTDKFSPPISQDLNPRNYYVWGVVERETNMPAHNTKDSLKAAVRDIMASMNNDHLINVY